MSQTGIAPEILRGLRESLHGTLICPGDEDYEDARRVWNGMIDRQPTLTVPNRFTTLWIFRTFDESRRCPQ